MQPPERRTSLLISPRSFASGEQDSEDETCAVAFPLKQPPHAEEELPVSGIAIRVGCFYWPEDRIDYDSRRTIGRETRCLVHHCVGRPINLGSLIDAQEIDAATQ